VESISPASASSFSLLAENTSGNWVKVVQRIPMRVRASNAPGKLALGRDERGSGADTAV
jgi:membrane fusion protein (multidrug efflux system)